MEKIGRYKFLAEPFHCDFAHRLFMGHLGNHLLNAADFHSTERGFGMNYLNPIHKTWVLSRLAIEMEKMPEQYTPFTVETWVEGAMRYFTNRNFRIVGEDGSVYGYGRSVWAMIDTDSRQPQDILAIRDGEIRQWIETEHLCPIEKSSRVKMDDDTKCLRSISTYYNDVDVNGHINSIKYIEHVLDLFPIDFYTTHNLQRFEIAYVAESHFGDMLHFFASPFMENNGKKEVCIRITKTSPYLESNVEERSENTEVCRCKLIFKEK